MKTIAGLLMMAALLAGCAKKDEVTVETPDGKVKISSEGEGGKTVIEGPEGKMTVEGDGKGGTVTTTNDKGETVKFGSSSDVDLAEFGVDVYPGAKAPEGGGGMSKVEGPQGTMVTAVFVTSDSVEKVLEYYKGKFSDPKTMSSPEGGFVTGKTKDGHDVTATAAKADGKNETNLSITVTTKKSS